MISVVIPLYNKGPYIRRAIESVLAQTYTDYEVVVVDDGSTDGGDKIVEGFTDSRIHLIRQPNAGVSSARNTGIQNAKADWIAFLDADDVWYNHNLSSHKVLLDQHPDVVWSAGLYSFVFPDGIRKDIVLPGWFMEEIKYGLVTDILMIMQYYYFFTSSIIINKKVFRELGLFDTTLKTAEDLDMWIRIGIKYPAICYCGRSISEYYKETPQSLTASAYSNFNNHHIPIINFVRKYLAAASQLSLVRAEGVRQLCINLLRNVVDMLLIAQVKMEAYKVLREFQKYLPKKFICKSFMKLLLPRMLCNFYQSLRKS